MPSNTNTTHWDDLRVLLAICRQGTLAGAAKSLGTSHSTVFRQLNAIEQRMSTRFFKRLPHGYEMTEAGEAVLQSATNIEEEVLKLSLSLHGKDLRLQGNIRLTAPEGVAHYLLSPYLASFQQQHPDIQIELIVTSHSLKLAQHQADLAKRVTTKPPQNCIGHKLSNFKIAIYASPVFLEESKHLALADYNMIMMNDGINWCSPSVWKNRKKPNIVFSCDSILAAVNAAKDGIGAANLPCFIGDSEPALQQIHPPLDDTHSELWILTHADLKQTARVKALMHHLRHCLSQDKTLLEGMISINE